MKKTFLLCCLVSILTLGATAQSTPTSITMKDQAQPGLQIELPTNTDIAEGTLLQKLKETGYKPETSGSMFWKKTKQDGFYVFQGVQLPDLNNQKLDLYFKIERKSKQEKDQSMMSMLVSKGYDNFISAESDSATYTAAANFLNGFIANTASYSLQQQIDTQDKVVKSAEKKLADYQDDDRSIQKKITQLQADAVAKRSDIEAQAKEIVAQRAALDALKAKVSQ